MKLKLNEKEFVIYYSECPKWPIIKGKVYSYLILVIDGIWMGLKVWISMI
jgi:hypothetical protein